MLQLPHTNIRFIPWHFCCSSAPRAAARGLIKWHGFRCGGGWSTTREFPISHHVFHRDHHLILFIHLQSSRQTCWIENCGLFFDTIQILILFPRGHKFTNKTTPTQFAFHPNMPHILSDDTSEVMGVINQILLSHLAPPAEEFTVPGNKSNARFYLSNKY